MRFDQIQFYETRSLRYMSQLLNGYRVTLSPLDKHTPQAEISGLINSLTESSGATLGENIYLVQRTCAKLNLPLYWRS